MLLRYAEVLKELKVHEVWLIDLKPVDRVAPREMFLPWGPHGLCGRVGGLAGCDLDSSYGLMTKSSTYLVGGLEHFWFLLMFPYIGNNHPK